MTYYRVLFFCALFLPGLVFASVRINEIAWMGTVASQYSEWIELYNDAAATVSLKDWKLYKTDNVLLYTLNNTIPANGYLLIERTTPSAPDAVLGITDEVGVFGGSGLRNTGEDLTLTDAEGTIMDRLRFANGWPAGDAKTKETMQWDGTAWITAPGTPDAVNATKNIVTANGATQSAQTPAAVPAAGGGESTSNANHNTETSNDIGTVDTTIHQSSQNNNNASTAVPAVLGESNKNSDISLASNIAGKTVPNSSIKNSSNSNLNSDKAVAGTADNKTKQVSPTAKPAKRTKNTTASISPSDISANGVATSVLEDQSASTRSFGVAQKENNHTKIAIIGAVAFCILALFLLLARFKVQKE